MRVLVVGSQYWLDEEAIRNEMINLPVFTTILHRGTFGADAISDRIAKELKMEIEVWQLAEERSGSRRESSARNKEMIQSGVDLCLAFPMDDSKGTWDCIRKSRAAHIKTIVIEK